MKKSLYWVSLLMGLGAFSFIYGEVASPSVQTPSGNPTQNSRPAEPFAFADFTWLNGNSRVKTPVIDTPYFTGTVMADVHYVYNFNSPLDNTIVGSSSIGRSGEFQLQQFGIGGDFHYKNVRARLMTQFGLYSTMTPRNDQSPAKGQWNLADAYRYLSEAYGGYHWDVWNGINLDAGIFMSYIGLFSYYNNENWAYQPSYVSSNTPWFFNGVRIQIFPSDRFKAEFWLVNGWQSYGTFNKTPGIGCSLLWRPDENTSWVTNDYIGRDTQNTPDRIRFHSDNSYQYKYLDKPNEWLTKAAFSLTGDIGFETGGGVTGFGGDASTQQYFLGAMAYNRFWFDHDRYAITIGGGFIKNPGRYLVLIPPIQQSGITGPNGGSDAISGVGTAFAPGRDFSGWDTSLTFDYMPDENITYRCEYNHRWASVPYFAGPGGVTSPDGWNTTDNTGFRPDLVQSEDRITFAMLLRL
jgi:hypothetical protein